MWVGDRGSNLFDGGAPFYAVYECADGRSLSVAPIEPHFYALLLGGLGLADADLPDQYDRERWPELRARLADVIRTKSRDEWVAVFDGTDACVAPVLSLTQAPQHPHLKARATFGEAFGIRQPAVAPRLSHTPGTIAGPPPEPGTHTETVLTEWGLDADLPRWQRVGTVTQTHFQKGR